MDRNLIVIW